MCPLSCLARLSVEGQGLHGSEGPVGRSRCSDTSFTQKSALLVTAVTQNIEEIQEVSTEGFQPAKQAAESMPLPHWNLQILGLHLFCAAFQELQVLHC